MDKLQKFFDFKTFNSVTITGKLLCLNSMQEFPFIIEQNPAIVEIGYNKSYDKDDFQDVLAKAREYLQNYLYDNSFNKGLEFTVHKYYVDKETVKILCSKIPALLQDFISEKDIIERLENKIEKGEDGPLIKSHPYLFKISEAKLHTSYYEDIEISIPEKTIPAHKETKRRLIQKTQEI